MINRRMFWHPTGKGLAGIFYRRINFIDRESKCRNTGAFRTMTMLTKGGKIPSC